MRGSIRAIKDMLLSERNSEGEGKGKVKGKDNNCASWL